MLSLYELGVKIMLDNDDLLFCNIWNIQVISY